MIGVAKPSSRRSSASWEHASPHISVVVSTRDRATYLRGLLDALGRQSLRDEDFEVVAVDDGSRDSTWDVLTAAVDEVSFPLLVARLETSDGPGPGRDVGVSVSRAPVVAFTDDDCLPAEGWIEGLLRSSQHADLIQGRVEPEPHSAKRSPWDRSIRIDRLTGLYETCNIAYRRDVFDRVGGFSVTAPTGGRVVGGAGTRPHFGEDVALGVAAARSGARVVFARDALVRHRWVPTSYRGWLAEQRRRENFPALVSRHPELGGLLWHRVFLSADTARFDAAVVGTVAALATRRPGLALGAVPWLLRRWPDARSRGGRHPALRLAQLALGDLVGLASLLRGSFRARRVIL